MVINIHQSLSLSIYIRRIRSAGGWPGKSSTNSTNQALGNISLITGARQQGGVWGARWEGTIVVMISSHQPASTTIIYLEGKQSWFLGWSDWLARTVMISNRRPRWKEGPETFWRNSAGLQRNRWEDWYNYRTGSLLMGGCVVLYDCGSSI